MVKKMVPCIDCGKLCHGKRCQKHFFEYMKGEEYSCKQSKAQKQAQNRLETKERKSKAMKAARARGTHDHIYTEEWRQKISEAMKVSLNRPEVKEKISEASKAAWARGAFDKRNASEEWKQKIANGVRAAHARGDFGEECRRKISEGVKASRARGDMDELFASEEWRQKSIESQNRPEVKRKKSEAMKKAHARGDWDGVYTDEWRQKISRALVGKYSGTKSPSWRGGTSPYDSSWTIELKKKVRERDGYKCAICGINAKCVHHIDYDKKNHDLNNLITLCRSCHARTNIKGRDFWQSYFEGQVYLAMGVC